MLALASNWNERFCPALLVARALPERWFLAPEPDRLEAPCAAAWVVHCALLCARTRARVPMNQARRIILAHHMNKYKKITNRKMKQLSEKKKTRKDKYLRFIMSILLFT